MRYVVLLYALFCFTALAADVSITTKANRSSLLLNEPLEVEISLSYQEATPPELFAFLYDLLKQPQGSFQVVSFSVGKPAVQGDQTSRIIHLHLAPTHTGTLIFAPGVIAFSGGSYLVPALSVECKSTGLSTLPLASLLPLYPERRIDLSPANRIALMNEKVLYKAQEQNIEAYQNYRLAWDGLAVGMVSIAFGGLFVWAIVYYELVERAKRPFMRAQTPLQAAIFELQDPNLSRDIRWQKLAEAFREALGVKTAQNLHTLSLFELADYVASSDAFSDAQKNELAASIRTLGDICYAAKPTSDADWQKLQAEFLKVATAAG